MSASKNEPPSARSATPPSGQHPLHTHAHHTHELIAEALAGMHHNVNALPHPLQVADKILRRAAHVRDNTELPDGLAERAIAKCLTLALDGSMAGEVVV